ncbi:hypothetical protein O181_120715 [Austropuccinia psidii MF-1]|uniref:Chromo domain-containing protein n=1 Tax=Austropuccinia psidii MF-1 TaxID=1389203 RepID=A0A9Q3Q1L0_9BASI|nr:hypothetical protein [Austropuccinia psidii MF-1]
MTWPIGPNLAPVWIAATIKEEGQTCGCDSELENKHPTFPVSLMKPYQPSEKDLFLLRNPSPLTVPPVEQSEAKRIKKVIKERRLRGKYQREYLLKYRNTVHEDKWLSESEIPGSDRILREFRHERRPQACICL